MSVRELKPGDVYSWCESLNKDLKPKTLILLKGTLGAGKTYLVNEWVKSLGGEAVSSPTYSLINHYQSKKNKNIYHVDLYRIKNDEDLESLGFWDLFNEEEAIVFVEWPSKVDSNHWPLDWNQLEIEIQKNQTDQSRKYFILKEI